MHHIDEHKTGPQIKGQSGMGVNHSRLEVTPALPAKEQVVDGVCYVLIEAFFHLRSTEMLNLHFHYSQWKDNCQGGRHSSKS